MTASKSIERLQTISDVVTEFLNMAADLIGGQMQDPTFWECDDEDLEHMSDLAGFEISFDDVEREMCRRGDCLNWVDRYADYIEFDIKEDFIIIGGSEIERRTVSPEEIV